MVFGEMDVKSVKFFEGYWEGQDDKLRPIITSRLNRNQTGSLFNGHNRKNQMIIKSIFFKRKGEIRESTVLLLC